MSPVSLCEMNDGSCKKGWFSKRAIPHILVKKMNVPELRKRCSLLNTTRDHAYTYRLDMIITYLCVKHNNLNLHLKGRSVCFSGEIGYGALTASTVLAIVDDSVRSIQIQQKMRIHHIFSLEIRHSKINTLSIGGCPDLLRNYQQKCHPSVCVCLGERSGGTLCHHFYMDSLLGGDLEPKTAHPFVVFLNGKITHVRYVAYMIFRLTDDVVFGGLLAKAGITLRFKDASQTPSLDSKLGFTLFRERSIYVTLVVNSCVDPKMLGETVLHELAHARVSLDMAHYRGAEAHGSEWLHRMGEIRKHLAYRLPDYAETLCTRAVKSHFSN